MEREREDDVIDLGTASVVTQGGGGPVDDQSIGKLFAGLTDD